MAHTRTGFVAQETAPVHSSEYGRAADRIRVHQAATGEAAYVWIYEQQDDGTLKAAHVRLDKDAATQLLCNLAATVAAIRAYKAS